MAYPSCPRPGHERFKVVRDGTYGKRKRQRYRCTDPDTGEFHRFVPPLPRQRVEAGVCDSCDNHVGAHEGPVVAARGLYEVREVAQAPFEVGRGPTYTDAARRTRTHYWGRRARGG